jgi:small subunit ribosomal protein S6
VKNFAKMLDIPGKTGIMVKPVQEADYPCSPLRGRAKRPKGGATMAKASEKYEVMYIISPKLSEEETAAVVEKFKGLVEANGTLEELEEMGKRKLAYEINYLTEGYYVLMKFTSGPEFPAELDRILGITDGILRRLITLRAE